MSWPERIPAAIEKAEGALDSGGHRFRFIQGTYPGYNEYLTTGEIALAKALEEIRAYLACQLGWCEEEPPEDSFPPALRAFVEKVEAL